MVAECIDQLAVSCTGTVLLIHVDNTVCLACCLKGRSRNKHINTLVRRLLLTCALHDIVPVFYFVGTHDNTLADAVSRGDVVRYKAALTWFLWPDTDAPLAPPPEKLLYAIPCIAVPEAASIGTVT